MHGVIHAIKVIPKGKFKRIQTSLIKLQNKCQKYLAQIKLPIGKLSRQLHMKLDLKKRT